MNDDRELYPVVAQQPVAPALAVLQPPPPAAPAGVIYSSRPGLLYPPQPGTQYSTFPPQPPKWTRRWGVTIARWGIGAAVVLLVSVVVTIVSALGAIDASEAGYISGYVMVGPIGYILFIPWWLDHIIARAGRLGVFFIHGGVSFLMAAFVGVTMATNPEGPVGVLGAGAPMLIWIVGWPLASLLAGLVRDSFAPKR